VTSQLTWVEVIAGRPKNSDREDRGMTTSTPQPKPGKRLALVGAGGNIGSHAAPHLARIPGIDRITLVDSGVYEAKDVWGQDITPRDFGKWKALVQARRLRAINPNLQVHAITEPIERVPLGLLRADVILAGLDSRRARQVLNEAAWHLNVPWIDAGVDGTNLVVRANVYRPGDDTPCLECGWSQQDYEQLEQSYPCRGNAVKAPATNAPSALGALAGSLQALECGKVLTGLTDRVLVSREVLLDASFHKHYVTSYRRNAQCRFDHLIWEVQELPGGADLGLRDVLAMDAAASGQDVARASLRVASSHFVQALSCAACGSKKRLLRLEASLRPADWKCGHCGGAMVATGFDRLDGLDAGRLTAQVLGRSLRSLGVRERDVVCVGSPFGERHYELTMRGCDCQRLKSDFANGCDVTANPLV
jgi:molybdopterin/thiamine biosynthesis adenylyltransferase